MTELFVKSSIYFSLIWNRLYNLYHTEITSYKGLHSCFVRICEWVIKTPNIHTTYPSAYRLTTFRHRFLKIVVVLKRTCLDLLLLVSDRLHSFLRHIRNSVNTVCNIHNILCINGPSSLTYPRESYLSSIDNNARTYTSYISLYRKQLIFCQWIFLFSMMNEVVLWSGFCCEDHSPIIFLLSVTVVVSRYL